MEVKAKLPTVSVYEEIIIRLDNNQYSSLTSAATKIRKLHEAGRLPTLNSEEYWVLISLTKTKPAII